MYVSAVINADLGRALAVPSEAVLNTGSRQLVFVQTGEGRYEPREIRTGHEASEFIEIVSGLKAGERVVTSANFLIDSESKLKAALSGNAHHH
jgi:Cu(I)/Ag(I) efflux system membrane fusion protein